MANEKRVSPWRYLILVPLVVGVGVIVALTTGPVANLAVPVIVVVMLGAFAWDIVETRRKGSGAGEDDNNEVQSVD